MHRLETWQSMHHRKRFKPSRTERRSTTYLSVGTCALATRSVDQVLERVPSVPEKTATRSVPRRSRHPPLSTGRKHRAFPVSHRPFSPWCPLRISLHEVFNTRNR
jgi:hypothetical protein